MGVSNGQVTTPPIRRWARPAWSWLTSLVGGLGAVRQMIALLWHAHPAGCMALLLLELVQGLLPPLSAGVGKALFDLLGGVVRGGAAPPTDRLIGLLAAQVGLAVGGQLLTALSTYMNSELNRRLSLDVQLRLYSQINQLAGLGPFEDSQFHDQIQQGVQGAQRGPLQMILVGTLLVRSGVTLAAFAGILLAFSPPLAGLVALSALPHLYVRLKLGRGRLHMQLNNTPRERRAGYYAHILSGTEFAKEVRLFGLADHFLAAFQRLYTEIYQAQRQQETRELRWQTGLTGLSSGTGALVFGLVLWAAFKGQVQLGDVILYTSAIASVQASLSSMVAAIANLDEGVLFYRHFTALLTMPQVLPIAANPQPVPPLAQGLELRDVSFRYGPDQPWVLCHVNLCLPAGQCVALVGLNGAGKSTLVKLLARLYDPTEGQILWDGVDIRQFDPVAYRRRLGTIFQDFQHYELTAQENIGLGAVEHAGDAVRVEQAARQVGLHDTITQLPQGYQTVLSRWLADEGHGVDLSGGQWQKIALARLFMRPADLLMLDEPTAALDAQAEYAIYQQFVALMAGRTSLLITHRFSTVRLADQIAVLEAGQITEYGPHATLLAAGKTYADLYQMQAAAYR